MLVLMKNIAQKILLEPQELQPRRKDRVGGEVFAALTEVLAGVLAVRKEVRKEVLEQV